MQTKKEVNHFPRLLENSGHFVYHAQSLENLLLEIIKLCEGQLKKSLEKDKKAKIRYWPSDHTNLNLSKLIYIFCQYQVNRRFISDLHAFNKMRNKIVHELLVNSYQKEKQSIEAIRAAENFCDRLFLALLYFRSKYFKIGKSLNRLEKSAKLHGFNVKKEYF